MLRRLHNFTCQADHQQGSQGNKVKMDSREQVGVHAETEWLETQTSQHHPYAANRQVEQRHGQTDGRKRSVVCLEKLDQTGQREKYGKQKPYNRKSSSERP